ncbi:hypothetical protein FB106_11481 [Synechococcus sp. Ace-Pa]|uniref:hypothetical protein n=1 Tax=Synechococcaceae TaxID=1890426 RepID=UPI0011A5D5A6|nr:MULTISPECIES: hypothetical protein [Synechococcaceae]MCT4365689.1 hypothetical protein [Candidatus Regnicoccus frigidus MAG-AL1]MCT4366768.1 hypothetical protein [Candidatus Regnicoccus frigidus MAG-AL2]TWB89073.1 hypothetical protein FB106_11481 [Synechococcus sp. Ace-Pa]
MPTWIARIDTPRRELQEVIVPLLVGPATTTVAFDGLGSDALIRRVNVNLASWITLYNSEAAFQADLLRPLNQDPEPGSGVVADLRFPSLGGGALLLAPGTSYSNAEQPLQRRLLARLRIEESGSLNPLLSIEAVVLTD